MNFAEPIEFREAVRQAAARKVLPTNLTSSELSQIYKGSLRTSMTSAQTILEDLLDNYKKGVMNIVNPEQVLRDGAIQTVTEGYNPATLRSFIKDYLDSISYAPREGEEGTIKDLSSSGRINLVIDTNVKTAHGAGSFVQQNSDPDVVDLWPALEFVRYEEREKERDWEGANGLFVSACRRAGDGKAIAAYGATGRMVALKSSGVWEELGNSEYTPGGLDNPYPPFAFKSGMWTEEVDRKEAIELGLLEEGEEAEPAAFDLSSLFGEAA